jgi:hypothetical protein
LTVFAGADRSRLPSTVEMRHLLVLLLLCAPAAADEVHQNARVRLGTGSETIVGELVETSDGRIVVQRDGRRVEVATRSIDSLEVSEGMQRRTLRYAWLGLLAGVGVGAATMVAIGRGGDENVYCLECVGLGAAAGAVVGGVIGHFVEREEWNEVDARSVKIVPRVNADGAALVLGGRF